MRTKPQIVRRILKGVSRRYASLRRRGKTSAYKNQTEKIPTQMTPRFNYALAAKPLKYKNNNLVIETIDLSAGIPYIYNLATAMQAITHGGLPSQTTAERILVKDWEFNIKFVLNYDTVSRGDKRFRVVCYRVNQSQGQNLINPMPTSNSVANVINFDVGTNDLKFFSNSAGTEIVLDEYVEIINPSFNVFDATPGEEGWLYNADPYSKVATMVKKFCIPVNMYATKAWTTAAHVDSIWTSYYTYYFAVMAILPGGGADAMGVALASQIAFRDA